MDVNGPGRQDRVISPHGVEEGLSIDGLPFVLHKVRQESELREGERDRKNIRSKVAAP